MTVAVQEGALPLSGAGPDGRPAGVHVTVARAVCERLDIDCAFAILPADRLLEALEAGAVDLVAADLAVTPDRAARVRFLAPHARVASLLIGRAGLWPDLEARTAPDRLAGRVVVAASGTDQARALADMDAPGATVVLAEHPRAGLDALHRGEADAALLPLAMALSELAEPQGRDLVALGPPLSAPPAGGAAALALASGDRGLAEAAGTALAALDRAGALRSLVRAGGDPVATVIPARALPHGAAASEARP
nr:transporter substrate-binding domain-containing protein [Roseospira navarrensis]